MDAEGFRRVEREAFRPVDAASLRLFRIAFGAVMAWHVFRYFQNGWIDSVFLQPKILFGYYGFEWLAPWPGKALHVHFAIMALAAIGIATGRWLRASAAVFFLAWTYVLLLCETIYQHHYYFISLVSLLLVFVPIGRAVQWAPAWALWLLRAQIAAPYFFGGIAKINAD